ncbi:MAG: hypothetical protein KDE53_36875, partial [Caldilineaceae bacterium]|nr:hypothetical protein [Caldilineaceae bacterium]
MLSQVEELLLHQETQAQQRSKAIVIEMKLRLWRLQPHDTQLLVEARHWMDTAGLTAEDPFNRA